MLSGDVLLCLSVPAMLLCLACSYCQHMKEEDELVARQQNGKGTALM